MIMPRLSKEFKEAIEEISVPDIRKLVRELAAKNQEIHELINLKYVTGKTVEQDLFEETKQKVLGEIIFMNYRRNVQKPLAKAISRAVKHINCFVKITKNKVLEAELLLALLNEVYDNYSDKLGTCWRVFDSKLAVTTYRFQNLVTTKLHEDYLIEYKEPLNRFLRILQTKSRHLDYIY